MIHSLHHVDLIIDKMEEEKARGYYCSILGFGEIPKPNPKKGGLWLQLENIQIHLSYETKEGIDPRKTKAHIAFQVSSLATLEATLKKNGLSYKFQDPLPGMRRLETEDPFGHRIEFLELI